MTNQTTRRRQATKKSLRQSLKELLQRRKRQTSIQRGQVGSGILRRGEVGIYLPEPSLVSLFPNFESSTQFDIDSYSAYIPEYFASEVEIIGEAMCSSPLASRQSLLPAKSLSQFNLNQAYADHGRPYRPTQLTTVPEVVIEGASRQASLVNLYTPKPSRSTLRIRDSKPSLRSERWAQFGASSTSTNSTSRSRSRESSSDLRSLASFKTSTDHSSLMSTPRPEQTRPKTRRESNRTASSCSPSIASIKHFGSFCVLDTTAPGCPVTATSEDLKYVFDVGEHFFLNNQECTDASMDIVTGFDAEGNEITHLVLFSPLISPSSGRSRFLLAALIDVTFFIKDVATVPELDTISEESIIDEGVATPTYHQSVTPLHASSIGRKNVRYELSCEDLLGGCFLGEEPPASSPTGNRGIVPGMGMYSDVKRGLTPTFDDIWTELAQEEMVRTRRTSSPAISTGSGHSIAKSSPSLSGPPSHASNVDSVLDSFMCELQQLYSEFFLLAKSPLDAEFYEICNVSPSVYVSRDYVQGHLSLSSRDTITQLSEQLGGDTAFDLSVRWGISGDTKQLYCIPLFGQRNLTWVCMLVDGGRLGPLW